FSLTETMEIEYRNAKDALTFTDIAGVFFFSSRRRHTRFSRDWSSDVCSSDLFESHQKGGGLPPVASRNRRYSEFVTWQDARQNPSTQTRCTGRSLSCPVSEPIQNQPSGMRTRSGARGSTRVL